MLCICHVLPIAIGIARNDGTAQLLGSKVKVPKGSRYIFFSLQARKKHSN